MKRHTLAVVIPFYGTAVEQVSQLDCQLQALVKQVDTPPFVIVVATSGTTPSIDAAIEAAAANAGALVRRSGRRLMPGGARNFGAAAVRSDFLVFVDHDDEVSPTYVREMCAALRESDLVAGCVDLESLNPGWPGRVRQVAQQEGLAGGFLPWGYGGTLGVRRSAFDHVSGFDASLRTAEDEDFCWRVQLAGYRMSFCPTAVVRYRTPTTMRSFWRQGIMYGAGQPAVDRRYGLVTRSLASHLRLAVGAVVLLIRGPGKAARASALFLLGRRLGLGLGSWRARNIGPAELGSCELLRQAPIPVYVIHWNAPEWCATAVSSILASQDVDVLVTVVNNSPELSAELRDALPQAVAMLDSGSNLGYTGAANLAVRDVTTHHPGAAVFVIASHDLNVEPDAFSLCIRALRTHPLVGIVGPYVSLSSNITTRVHQSLNARAAADTVVDVAWVSGQCMVVRTACARTTGAFDERLGSYAEDVDFGWRARQAGWKVGVVPTAHAHGLGSASPHAWELTRANNLVLAFKHRGLPGYLADIGRLVVQLMRSMAGTFALWRSVPARRASRTRACSAGRVARQAPGRLKEFRNGRPTGKR